MNQEIFGMYFLYGIIILLILAIIFFAIRYFFFPQEETKPIKKRLVGNIYEVKKQEDGTWATK